MDNYAKNITTCLITKRPGYNFLSKFPPPIMDNPSLANQAINRYSQFEQAGFAHIEAVLQPETCHQLCIKIQHNLTTFIASHSCSDVEYFSSVNRWPASSLLDSSIETTLITKLQASVSHYLNVPLVPYEVDVIYKSSLANLATPVHQDIAYAYKRPYLASTWLALTNVAIHDSPLQFLPGSHRFPIAPAIDFWQPEFIDQYRNSLLWQQHAKEVPVSCGDVILFSSRIWHASLAHTSSQPRIVIVVRWGNEDLMYPPIPLPGTTLFGMWNCGEYTATLLKEGLKIITHEQIDNFVQLIQTWQALIQENKLPFNVDKNSCIAALTRLRILHEAYNRYQGGDGQGIVYATLWQALLKSLKTYLAELTHHVAS